MNWKNSDNYREKKKSDYIYGNQGIGVDTSSILASEYPNAIPPIPRYIFKYDTPIHAKYDTPIPWYGIGGIIVGT